MHTPPSAPRMFVGVRALSPSCRPCHVTRHIGLTYLACHEGATRREIIAWTERYLTVAERNILRTAYGQPPVGKPLHDWVKTGPVLRYVPPSLRTRQTARQQELDHVRPGSPDSRDRIFIRWILGLAEQQRQSA